MFTTILVIYLCSFAVCIWVLIEFGILRDLIKENHKEIKKLVENKINKVV